MELATHEMIEQLYKLYSPIINGKPKYKFGDKIVVNFSIGTNIEGSDVSDARNFAEKLREQISTDDASIEQSASKVIIQPK